MIELIIGLVITGSLLLLGLSFGRLNERRHFADLDRREAQVADIVVTDLRSYIEPVDTRITPVMVIGEVVIGSDYLKTFLTGLKKIIGGELRSFETLMERARREALLRAKENARTLGCNALCNVRMSPADVGGANAATSKNKAMPMVAILCTATAYRINN